MQLQKCEGHVMTVKQVEELYDGAMKAMNWEFSYDEAQVRHTCSTLYFMEKCVLVPSLTAQDWSVL